MLKKSRGTIKLLLIMTFLSTWGHSQTATESDVSRLPLPVKKQIDFQQDVAPLLKEKCQVCHGAEKQMGGLRLDDPQAVMRGGYSGTVITKGDSAGSRLIHLVAGLNEKLLMPLSGERLTAHEVGLLRAWIDQGAEWSLFETHTKPSAARPSVMNDHWAFRKPARPLVPKVRNRAFVKNPIDAFVVKRLEAESLSPSPEADRATLIRRISLDLTGLLPTPAEVDHFVADADPKAYERLVERLLESPHYGEKWARHWLDLAHYADTDGFESDRPRAHAWRWRDWVIEALNSNMPFNQFTLEQIAGDLLPNATTEQKVATGFFRNTLTNREQGINVEEYRVEQVIDRASTVGTVWLGMTLGCARCHDHKYDPITQREFYQLYAFFNKAHEVNIEAPVPGEMGPYLQRKREYERKRQALLAEYEVPERQIGWERKLLEVAENPGKYPNWDVAWHALALRFEAEYGQQIIRRTPWERTKKQADMLTDHFIGAYQYLVGKEKYEKELKFKELNEKLQALKREYPGLSEAQTLADNPNAPKNHILVRGNFRNHGIEVEPNTPAVLSPLNVQSQASRLDLARWLVSKDNPLTSRVTVNRMWQEFFGRGLVETSEDFGVRGERPSHLELLDWLAIKFMDSGWNVKQMHRLMVTSATYRQISKVRKDLESRDPFNRLLARQSSFRLSAELIRDAALLASGLLNPAIGGRSVRPQLPPGVAELGFKEGIKWETSKGFDAYRRGLYIFFQRTVPYPQLMAFDGPDSLSTCSRRERSTTALQALNLLNDPVFVEAAQGLAARVLQECPGTAADRIDYAVRLCLARWPKAKEKDRLIRYYDQQRRLVQQDPKSIESLFPATGVERADPEEAAVWVGLSSVLLNLDEFITRR